MIYTEYNSVSGEMGGIHSGYDNATDAKAQIFLEGMNEVVDGGYNNQTHYISNGQPTKRPASPITIDGMTLMNVPAASTLLIDGDSYEAEGDVELEFPVQGTYKITVICFPYLDWSTEVTV